MFYVTGFFFLRLSFFVIFFPFIFFSPVFFHLCNHQGPPSNAQFASDEERRKVMLEQQMFIQKQRLEAMASLSAEALLPPVKPEAEMMTHPHQRLGSKTGPQTPQRVLLRDFRVLQSDPSPSTHAHKVFSLKRQYFICLMQKVGCSNWLHYIKVLLYNRTPTNLLFALLTWDVTETARRRPQLVLVCEQQ